MPVEDPEELLPVPEVSLGADVLPDELAGVVGLTGVKPLTLAVGAGVTTGAVAELCVTFTTATVCGTVVSVFGV